MIPSWIIALAAVAALLLSIYNTVVQRRDKQRRVTITTNQRVDEAPAYICTITNTGMIGVTISRVMLEPRGGGAVNIVLRLPSGEQQRKLDSGESQEWGIYLDEIGLEGPPKIPVTVVATDTTGEEYRSKPEETLPVKGSHLQD